MKKNDRLLVKFATDYSTADKEGFLLKKGEVNKGFQKRFFVLRANLLFYFEKKQDREPIGVIILDNCRIELCPSETSLFAFQIIFEGVGTRTYILAANTEECMQAWMKKLTHAGHACLSAVVTDLEKRLEELKQREANMTTKLISNSDYSSDSDDDDDKIKDQRILPTALPNPASLSLTQAKCKTLPSRKSSTKQAHNKVSKNRSSNRWSLSASFPSDPFQGSKSFDSLKNLSERMDFLSEDTYHAGRHFSMAAFTPPSFSELREKQEKSEDQNLIDLSTPDGELPFERKIEITTLSDRFKGNRRAKSERHRGKNIGLLRGAGGSLYSPKKQPSDDLKLLEDNSESTFQHLHRLWGATIWVKVREYELQQSKQESSDSRL